MLEIEQISDKISAKAFSITVALPADADHGAAMRQVGILCVAIGRSELTLKHARILLGRMMMAVKNRRLYEPEFENFEDFKGWVIEKYRLSRPTLQRALRFAKALPDMEPEEAEPIPFDSLNLLAQIAGKADKRQMAQLRKEAATAPIIELRAKAVGMNLLKPQGRPSNSETRRGPVMLKLTLTPALRRRWADMRGDESDSRFLARLLDMLKGESLKAA